jgi:hypothetical protein
VSGSQPMTPKTITSNEASVTPTSASVTQYSNKGAH